MCLLILYLYSVPLVPNHSVVPILNSKLQAGCHTSTLTSTHTKRVRTAVLYQHRKEKPFKHSLLIVGTRNEKTLTRRGPNLTSLSHILYRTQSSTVIGSLALSAYEAGGILQELDEKGVKLPAGSSRCI